MSVAHCLDLTPLTGAEDPACRHTQQRRRRMDLAALESAICSLRLQSVCIRALLSAPQRNSHTHAQSQSQSQPRPNCLFSPVLGGSALTGGCVPYVDSNGQVNSIKLYNFDSEFQNMERRREEDGADGGEVRGLVQLYCACISRW